MVLRSEMPNSVTKPTMEPSGQHGPGGEDRQYPADEGEGQVDQDQHEVARATRDHSQQQHDAEAREPGEQQQVALGPRLGLRRA